MLLRLLRTYLRNYRVALLGVLVFQGVQSLASLFLPTGPRADHHGSTVRVRE